ncbi:MAG: hypothetical protein P0120_15100 [Nitrospira sp.]|nr:hypothetical protein [Nitrospira sp.]
MRVACGHAGHPMAEKRLSHFIIDAKTLQSGGERMAKVVEVEILDFGQTTGTSPILLERPHVIPSTEHSAVSE